MQFAILPERLKSEFANYFQHLKTRIAVTLILCDQKVMFYERRYAVQNVKTLYVLFPATNRFRGCKRESPDKYRQASEQVLLLFIKQIVAPLNSSPHRLLANWHISWATGQQLQLIFESRKNRVRRHQFRPRRRKFDC